MADIDADKVQSLIQSALESAARASQLAEKALADGESLVRIVNESPLYMDNEAMTGVSKDLLDARLETIEARMDARVVEMSAKLDIALAEMRADREAGNLRFTRMEGDLQDVKLAMSTMSADVDRKLTSVATQTSEQVKSLKANIWFGVATTVAVVGATLAIAISSFDSGRETSKSIAEATARMEKLQSQLEAQVKAAASTATSPPK